MIALGIESTAHTIGIGIVQDKKILANCKRQFKTKQGGIKPREAADFILENFKEVLEEALEKAKVEIKDIDVIGFAKGPGLGPCLDNGAVGARTLALEYKKPLIGVNHAIAHLEIGKLDTGAKNPIFVYASGANTQIIGYYKKKYRVYGETLDIGIGNMLDMYGRYLGLGFPAGPEIDKLYFQGKKYIQMPYTIKGMDLNFSGLLTSAQGKKGTKEDLAYSVMHTAFAMLTEVTERALAHTGKKEVLVIGGVASSKALKEMMEKMCEERKAKAFFPKKEVCVDNGAMIAYLTLLMKKAGVKQTIKQTETNQNFRIDYEDISWINDQKYNKEESQSKLKLKYKK